MYEEISRVSGANNKFISFFFLFPYLLSLSLSISLSRYFSFQATIGALEEADAKEIVKAHVGRYCSMLLSP
jgi:hypothetical protein